MMMNVPGKKLKREFYLRSTLRVAWNLLGTTIVYRHPHGVLAARIVETEAYIGEDDPACHAAVGRTARNDVMYGPGGFGYIYFIYGMYNCFNVVTERTGFPAAVLIRAVEPMGGEEIMKANSPANCRLLTNGPGKFCRAYGLTRRQNGLDLTGSTLYIVERENYTPDVVITRRIGIKKGAEKPWRFYDRNSRFVSGRRIEKIRLSRRG
jgi:DNA-3-methyladenine glycosylase